MKLTFKVMNLAPDVTILASAVKNLTSERICLLSSDATNHGSVVRNFPPEVIYLSSEVTNNFSGEANISHEVTNIFDEVTKSFLRRDEYFLCSDNHYYGCKEYFPIA